MALFERRPRSLALTEKGRILHRAAAEFLERLQETTDRLRDRRRHAQVILQAADLRATADCVMDSFRPPW